MDGRGRRFLDGIGEDMIALTKDNYQCMVCDEDILVPDHGNPHCSMHGERAVVPRAVNHINRGSEDWTSQSFGTSNRETLPGSIASNSSKSPDPS